MAYNQLTRLIFNKAGFGKSISREETVERLNPLIKQHMELNLSYNDVIARISNPQIKEGLEQLQKIARADVGKLMETVFSSGGTAYNGVELEPDDVHLGETDDEMLFLLLDQEEAFKSRISEETTAVNHHVRTRAILNLLATNSQERFNYLKEATKRRRRPTAAS